MKLEKTKIIKGTIIIETGLHIGGSKSSLNIGGLDSPVVKTPQGIPYIPGSSLKGKIRTLLGLKEGSVDVNSDKLLLRQMFGFPGNKSNENSNNSSKEEVPAELSRLIFRDAMLDKVEFEKDFKNAVLDTKYTETKDENTIDRKSGKSKSGSGLRQIERVPAGTKFQFEIVINIFDGDDEGNIVNKLRDGIKLLEDNYLGGSGSRGYGKVKFCYEKNETK